MSATRSSGPVLAHRIAAFIPRRLRFEHIDHRVVILSIYAALNVGLALYFIPEFLRHPGVNDYALWQTIPAALENGRLYHGVPSLPFVWSPVAAWLLIPVVAIGYWAWAGVHLIGLLALREWRLIGLTLMTWPFWHDVVQGNAFAFAFIAGAAALRGSRPAGIVYLALLLLMPRPVQLPLALWLLWKSSSLRWPFVLLFVAHGAVVLGSGYADDWWLAMTSYGINGPAQAHTDGPPAWLGTAWLIVGVPLGFWLTTRGRVGWAGLAVSPYWLMPYYLMLLLELKVFRQRESRSSDSGVTASGTTNGPLPTPSGSSTVKSG